jgi:hypothetical protein
MTLPNNIYTNLSHILRVILFNEVHLSTADSLNDMNFIQLTTILFQKYSKVKKNLRLELRNNTIYYKLVNTLLNYLSNSSEIEFEN